MVNQNCGVIPAQENIYAIWDLSNKSIKEYCIEKVIAFHYECDDQDAFLKPICLNKELISECTQQIIFYGTIEECEKEMKRLEMISNVSNQS